MKLVVAIEHHFVETGGRIYTALSFGYEYWKEYLEVFDEVYVLARVGYSDVVPKDHFVADGPGVKFIYVPDYLGIPQFLIYLPGVFVAAFRAARLGTCFILRSGNVCTALWLCLKLLGKPYSREVQGYIEEGIIQFTRHNYPLIGRAIARVSDHLARVQARGAFCASYVSQFCRSLYPTKNPDREFVFSSVRLTKELLRGPRSEDDFKHKPFHVLSVGRLELEKGHHILVEAAHILRMRGVEDWRMKIVGGGRQLNPLREKVEKLDLDSYVEIVGPVQYGEHLFEYLDGADLFVLPSLTEGMPRSLIEAMARGLPAIGSRTGGTIELLSDSQLVVPGQSTLLAEAIASRIGRFDKLAANSRKNFEKASTEYNQERMRQRKLAYWKTVLAGPQGLFAESSGK
jgi:glycosyltransferase involved in cell wall biosynthesis